MRIVICILALVIHFTIAATADYMIGHRCMTAAGCEDWLHFHPGSNFLASFVLYPTRWYSVENTYAGFAINSLGFAMIVWAGLWAFSRRKRSH